ISYEALNSMILSKIAERRPESIRCPWASIVSLAAMASFYPAGLQPRPTAAAIAEADVQVPLGLRDEPVADAADSLQEFGRGGTIFDVAPEPDDEVVDR